MPNYTKLEQHLKCRLNRVLFQVMLSNYMKITKGTRQLRNEEIQKKYFSSECRQKYGLIIIKDWGSGSENKKKNSNADLTCEIDDVNRLRGEIPQLNSKFKNGDHITVSLKTDGGNFTVANCGTTHNRTDLFKKMDLSEENIQRFKEVNDKTKHIKHEIIRVQGKQSLWKDNMHHKQEIKHLYRDLFFNIFSDTKNSRYLYNWLEERDSDLKYVGNILRIPYKKQIPEHFKVSKVLSCPDSIYVGHFKLRVKCESKCVIKPWKINIEHR
jgi:hypothetical protein